MVIGLLAIAAIPTVTGVGNALSAQQRTNAATAKEQLKFHLAPMMKVKGQYEDVGLGVLVDNKLYLDLKGSPVEGHKFLGYYFKYPSEEGHQGLVSTISNDPPALNWIYVNRDTHAVMYGGRKDTLDHVIGPWAWSEDEKFLTLEGQDDTFVAVCEPKDGKDKWVVYWDPEGEIRAAAGSKNCRRVKLRRQMQLGIESSYVRD